MGKEKGKEEQGGKKREGLKKGWKGEKGSAKSRKGWKRVKFFFEKISFQIPLILFSVF